MRININILSVVIITALLSCKHYPTESEFTEGLNKYPTTFPNLESDVYYFQEKNLIQFDHIKQTEINVLTTNEKPLSVQCIGSRKYIFYDDIYFGIGVLKRFSVANKVEIEFKKDLGGYYPSYDGEKLLYGDLFVTNYYNHLTGVDKEIGSIFIQTIQSINDTTVKIFPVSTRWAGENIIKTELWLYKRVNDTVGYYLPNKLVYTAVENDSFRVLSITDIKQISSEWTYNIDSSYAYSIRKISGFPRGYILNVKTGEQKQILAEEGQHLMWSIDYSPSGKQIVFSLYFSQGANQMEYVFVSNADGSSPALISNKTKSSMRAVFVSK